MSQMSEPATARWTGWLEVNVHDSRDWTAGTLQLVVGPDDFVVTYDGRRCDTIDRERFRRWLSRPDVPFYETNTTWTLTAGVLVARVLSHAALALVVLPAEIGLLRQAITGRPA